MITKEQYEKLKPYEDNLNTSFHADYCRNLGQNKVKVLDEIYRDIFGKASQLKSGCSFCVLESMKELAREYYHYVPQVQNEPKPKKVTNSVSDNKPKKGKTKATNK